MRTIVLAAVATLSTISSSVYAQGVVPVPGTIQVERYDSALDHSAGNQGSLCREGGDVDLYRIINPPDAPTLCYLDGTEAGEWVAFTIRVNETNTYVLSVRSSSPAPAGWFHVEIDDVDVTGQMRASNTGNWELFQTTHRHGIFLTEGIHTLRLRMDTPSETTGVVGGFDYLALTTSIPFTGSPSAVPGRIEAEDFDNAATGRGRAFAYFDTTSPNEGGAYRNDESVDIRVTTDADGGYVVSDIRPTEWLAYTVDVAATGLYTLRVRVTNPGAELALGVSGISCVKQVITLSA